MIENRDLWLETVFAREAGYVNDPDDSGGPTNMGCTIATLSSWRGTEVTAQDVKDLTKDEARAIFLARYWQAVRGDQLPSGIDIYVGDMAILQGPGSAARILQQVVHTENDGFIGPKTIEACRKLAPMQVLLDLHDARMEYLEGRPKWDKYGKGWSNRCRIVRDVARSCIDKRPTLTEMASSTIVKGAAVGAAVSGTTVVTTTAYDWGQLWDVLQRLLGKIPGLASGLPEALQSAEPGVRGAIDAANQTAAMPGLAGHLTAGVTLGTSLWVIWRRYRMYAKGLS